VRRFFIIIAVVFLMMAGYTNVFAGDVPKPGASNFASKVQDKMTLMGFQIGSLTGKFEGSALKQAEHSDEIDVLGFSRPPGGALTLTRSFQPFKVKVKVDNNGILSIDRTGLEKAGFRINPATLPQGVKIIDIPD
jgi:hypothetical protein